MDQLTFTKTKFSVNSVHKYCDVITFGNLHVALMNLSLIYNIYLYHNYL